MTSVDIYLYPQGTDVGDGKNDIRLRSEGAPPPPPAVGYQYSDGLVSIQVAG